MSLKKFVIDYKHPNKSGKIYVIQEDIIKAMIFLQFIYGNIDIVSFKEEKTTSKKIEIEDDKDLIKEK